jgi:hypothetical protein
LSSDHQPSETKTHHDKRRRLRHSRDHDREKKGDILLCWKRKGTFYFVEASDTLSRPKAPKKENVPFFDCSQPSRVIQIVGGVALSALFVGRVPLFGVANSALLWTDDVAVQEQFASISVTALPTRFDSLAEPFRAQPLNRNEQPMPSKFNAITHGLTAKIPLDPEEFELQARAVKDWIDELGCSCNAEKALIAGAAEAEVRRNRCIRAHEAALRINHAENHREWIKKQRQGVRKLAQSLKTNPGQTLEALEETSYGCEWLLNHWKSIDAFLAQGVMLSPEQGLQIMQLSGYLALTPGPDSFHEPKRLWALQWVAVHGEKKPDHQETYLPMPSVHEQPSES